MGGAASQFTRSSLEAQNDLPLFLVAFSRLPLSLFLSCHFALSLPLLSCDLWPLQFKGFAEQRWRERKGGRKGKVAGKEW